MTKVACTTLHGETVYLPAEKLQLRVSAYALLTHEGRALLIRNRNGGKLYLPGGGVELGEHIRAALRRELKEETGIEIAVEGLAHVREDFFYYDPWDEAYHEYLFYYRCTPLTFDLLADDEVEDEEASQPRWMDLAALRADDFQNHGELLCALLQAPSPTEGDIPFMSYPCEG